MYLVLSELGWGLFEWGSVSAVLVETAQSPSRTDLGFPFLTCLPPPPFDVSAVAVASQNIQTKSLYGWLLQQELCPLFLSKPVAELSSHAIGSLLVSWTSQKSTVFFIVL